MKKIFDFLNKLWRNIINFLGFGECHFIISGVKCGGRVRRVAIFSGTITMPMCKKHFNEHKKIMLLHHIGLDVEDVLKMSSEEKERTIGEKSKDLINKPPKIYW